jgi:hypothetical protein
VTAIECWAPECSVSIPVPPRGRHPKYCSGACRQRAVRRNGGKAPSEPYNTGLHQNAPAATVVAGPETGSRRGKPPEGRRGPDADVLGGDTANVTRNVTPPPLAGGGKAGSPDHVDGPPEHGPQYVQPPGDEKGPSTAAPSAPPAATFSDVPSPVGESAAKGGYSVATGDSPPAPDAPPASPEQAAPTLSIVPPPSVPDPPEAAPEPPPPTAFYLSVVAELESIGQHQSRKGLQALAIVSRIESPNTSAAAIGTLSKELDRFLDEIKHAAPKRTDAGEIVGDRVRAKILEASRIASA